MFLLRGRIYFALGHRVRVEAGHTWTPQLLSSVIVSNVQVYVGHHVGLMLARLAFRVTETLPYEKVGEFLHSWAAACEVELKLK